MIKRNTIQPFTDTSLGILRNHDISLRAKGLYFWLISQSDDFELNTKALATYNKENPQMIQGAIRELEKLGYIETLQQGCGDMSYIIYDTPQPNVSQKFKKQELDRKKTDNATKDYIKKYLTPNKHFKRTESIDTILDKLRNPPYPVDWDYVSNYVNDYLTYDEFLSTEYWEIISIWKKIHSNFTCELCGKKYNIMSKLNIHHSSYLRHGEEHLQDVIDDDLHCWCNECHESWHANNDMPN